MRQDLPSADETCITCGQYGQCSGSGGGGTNNPPSGDANVITQPSNVAVQAWGHSDDPNKQIVITFDYTAEETGAHLGSKSTSGYRDVNLNDNLGVTADGAVTAYSAGFWTIIIAVVIMVAGVIIVTKTFRSGRGKTCWSDPFIDSLDGKCTYAAACWGNQDCIDQDYKRDPANGNCPATVSESYRWAGWMVGGSMINKNCTPPVYATVSSCECE